MQRELSSFNLPPLFKKKLFDAGYVTVEDIHTARPVQLSKELDVSNEDALEILQTIKEKKSEQKLTSSSRTLTAFEMLKDEQFQQNIITFSEQLDNMLGGGIPLLKITEICGAPGIGKTQMSMQLAVDVQIPECFGGVDGEAIYIDTEGSFIVERVIDIANACIKHCKQIALAEKTQEHTEAMSKFTLEYILKKIHYYRIHNYVELIALVHLLPEFLKEHPQVKLIVVDSIAFPFRHDFEDMSLRTRILNGMAQSFLRIATDDKLAVVLINQMTTKIGKQKQSELVPALGESWGHAATIRVILYWENSQRLARLYKSPYRQETTVPYQITLGGIRDVHHEPEPDSAQASDSQSDQRDRKRARTDDA